MKTRKCTRVHVAQLLIASVLAIWVFNFWLWLAFQGDRGRYLEMRAAGAEWFTCVDWDAEGHSHPSDRCDGPAPAFEPEGGGR